MSQKCPNCHKVIPDGSRYCSACGHDMAFKMPADGILPPGTILRGSYVIENMIGEGGMGVVYACHHKTLGKKLALKVLEPKYARIPTTRSRFLSEGMIQANLAHPHIVRVIDVIDSEKEGGMSGILAIVMEYVKGDSLDHIIRRGPLSEFDAVSTTLVMLDAIGYAHHQKIIHRDLKPSNIMVDAELAKEALYNGIKVMDFGIAKLIEKDQQLTGTGVPMGTLLYMPPEQIKSARAIDERADLYAIGMTLYELLCGRTPFAEYREFELMQAQLNMKPPSIKNFRRNISDRLEAIIMKSLEKDRENRYANAEAFQRALLSLGGYDDIPLLLNPCDGMSIQTTNANTKLQNKIRQAIDRTQQSKPVDAKEAAEKAQRAEEAKNVARNVKKLVVKSEHSELHTDKETSSEAPKKAPTTEGEKKTRVRKKSETAPTKATKTHTPQIASDTPNAQDVHHDTKIASSETSSDEAQQTQAKPKKKLTRSVSGEFKKSAAEVKKSAINLKAPTSSGQNSKRASKATVNVTEAEVSQPPKSTAEKQPIAETKPKSRRRTQLTTTESSAQNTRPHVSNVMQATTIHAIESAPKPISKARLALSIVVLLIFILAVTGLVYRTNTHMPSATTAVPVEAPPPAQTEPIDDISILTVKTIDTPSGRMTLIPAARHHISTDKSDELKIVELPAYYIDQTEVSHYQYAKCVASEKCPPLGQVPTDPNLPVTGIGLGSAEAFCQYAGKQLPTAEQWEAAARFGGKTNGITFVNVSCDTIHFGATSDCKKQNVASPLSVFSHTNGNNPGHIRNMLGNVREWVTTPDASQKKVQTKGGSYLSSKKDINIGASTAQAPNQGAADLGFRCVKTTGITP